MPHKQLPTNPNLAHLRHQAHDLVKGHALGDPAVLQRIREFHPEFRHLTDEDSSSRPFKLSAAQLTLAREYMFPSWPKMKSAIEEGTVPDESVPLEDRITDPAFREAVRCIDTGNVEGLRNLLADHPLLAKQHVYYSNSNYFGQPGLLQFVAENPIRQWTMPNALAITQVILDAGPNLSDINDMLGLVATGRVPREQGVQIALIDLLCQIGATIQGIDGVLAHGEFEAAEALLRHGAKMTLQAAAAMGKLMEFEKLAPSATREERHLALAFASQFGHTEIVQKLLDMGEDPNRYNPPGAHGHSTPLHQAVIHNHPDTVKLLLQRGARSDIPDTLFDSTAVGWAEYATLPDIAHMLKTWPNQH